MKASSNTIKCRVIGAQIGAQKHPGANPNKAGLYPDIPFKIFLKIFHFSIDIIAYMGYNKDS